MTANPAVVSDCHGACPLFAGDPFFRGGAVAGGINPDVRPDEAVVADGDIRLVQHREPEICEKVLPYPDVPAVVAEERLVYDGVIVAFSQYPVQHPVAFFRQ